MGHGGCRLTKYGTATSGTRAQGINECSRPPLFARFLLRINLPTRMTMQTRRHAQTFGCLVFAILFIFSPFLQPIGRSQTEASKLPTEQVPNDLSQILRLEKIEVAGGSELLTVSAKLVGVKSESDDQWVPLVSILRDTLGDSNRENDRLRYVWPLTYTSPTLKQRLAAAIPFFYTRIGSKQNFSEKPPP